ncbi:NAD-dependent epimerase/dehydratase family protein [Pedobacter hartonius]|uniref:Nucleoside-diphosphate-sugar epimerase n=1 Tax=Pedobacter hartonius TaxID=425514 RepID=A0A1H4FR75_9SPHI|nr:NAD(P)-dependent oxidoreductase [Pedobacter hartonius]SEA99641.1 Nucleoside-diphosphate-sugar epimerase [Pedobacter hartonius]
MKIAITGATGFIGKKLVMKHLEMGDDVQIMSRKKRSDLDFPELVKVHHLDLMDQHEKLISFVEGIDVLYHCAAEIKDESKMFQVNVQGTKNLLDAAKGRLKHWVQLSSTGVYGHILSGEVFETQKIDPMNTYERSKVAADNLVIYAGLNNFFTYGILRPSNVFGPEMSNQSLFQLVRALDKGMFFFIGPKGANANYVPVDNVVQALILVGRDKRANGRIYNISDTRTIEEFIAQAAKCLGKAVPKLRVPLFLMKGLGLIGNMIPGSPLTTGRVDALSTRVRYDIGTIEKELDYTPVVTMEQVIEDLVEAYRRR